MTLIKDKKLGKFSNRYKKRLMTRLSLTTLAVTALIFGVLQYYNTQAGDPITLTTTANAWSSPYANQSLVIVADNTLKSSLDKIIVLFNKRHNTNIKVHYHNSQDTVSHAKNGDNVSLDGLSADLWLNFSPQSKNLPISLERFDFAILENQAPNDADGRTISTKPNTPPLSGQLLTDKPLSRAFKHFLLSSIAQDVFIQSGLQSIEPVYDTKAFFSTKPAAKPLNLGNQNTDSHINKHTNNTQNQ